MNDIGVETVMDPVVPWRHSSRLLKRYRRADGERKTEPTTKEVEKRLNEILK